MLFVFEMQKPILYVEGIFCNILFYINQRKASLVWGFFVCIDFL